MNNEWVQDPKVFNINREKAHASIHRLCLSRGDAYK